MVPGDSIFAMVITLAISFLFPALLYIILRRSSKNITGAVVAGAVAFFVSQMLIRLPLLQGVFPKFEWFHRMKEMPLLFILFFALTAALFEETARYLAFTFLLKGKQAWKCGIAFGIGHGGIEAIMLVGITYVNNLVYSLMVNAGTFYSKLQGSLDHESIRQIEKALVETPAATFYAAGFERIFVILLHIALSIIILEGVVRKHKLGYYLTAIIVHTGVNYVSAYLAYRRIDPWFIEMFLAFVAIVAVIYVIRSKKRFGDKIEAIDEAQKAIEDGY